MLGRPTVALRGSFRPRLASTTGEDPRATTDPVESPSEYRHGLRPANARAAVSSTTSVHAGVARAHPRTPPPSHPSSGRRRRGGRGAGHAVGGRRSGSNAPRIADAPLLAGPPRLRRGRHRRAREPDDGQVRAGPDGRRQRSRLVVAALGQPPSRERHPGDRVGGVVDRRRPWRRRAQPPRSAIPRTSVGWIAARAGPAYRNGERATLDRRRRAVVAALDGVRARATAALAPRRAEHLERARGTVRRTASAPCRSRRIAAGTRRRAPERARHDAIGDPADTCGTRLGQVQLDRGGEAARHRSSTVDCVRMTG